EPPPGPEPQLGLPGRPDAYPLNLYLFGEAPWTLPNRMAIDDRQFQAHRCCDRDALQIPNVARAWSAPQRVQEASRLGCVGARVRNWHEAAVRKCPFLRRLWGLSGHRSPSSICEYTPYPTLGYKSAPGPAPARVQVCRLGPGGLGTDQSFKLPH